MLPVKLAEGGRIRGGGTTRVYVIRTLQHKEKFQVWLPTSPKTPSPQKDSQPGPFSNSPSKVVTSSRVTIPCTAAVLSSLPKNKKTANIL